MKHWQKNITRYEKAGGKFGDWTGHSDIATPSNIYMHLDFTSKVSSANTILPSFPDRKYYLPAAQ